MLKLTRLLLPVTVFVLACGTEDNGSTAGVGGSGDGGVETDDVGATSEGASSNGQESADETAGPEPADIPARAIQISLVEANTGVAVAIGANGEWVGAEGRNSPLPKGRNTAIRVYVDVDEDIWVQRDIEARLHVHLADGTVETQSLVETISGDSSTASLQSGYLFGALAEWMEPGVQYQVELFEAGEGYEGLPEATEPPRTPPTPDLIGAEQTELELKVVMIPVNYSGPGCTSNVEATDETLGRYADAMYQQNPVENLEIEWAPAYTVNDLDLSDPGDFFSLLNRAVSYRAQANPAPNVYYYMLFENCGACIGDGGGCTLGVAPGTPDASMGAAQARVAIGTQFLGGSEVGIETFVHEIGHSQGRAHVACPGASAAGPDPSFPHENGSIGVWGFGVRDFGVRNPSNHTDYMSYCNPTWVSDWQWNATYDRIRTLTSWDTGDMEMPPGQSVLVGMTNPVTNETDWFVDEGYIADGTELATGHELRFKAGNRVLETAGVHVDEWSEGGGLTIRAPVPAGWDGEVTSIEYVAPNRRVEASRQAIADYRRPEALTQP
ncbi:MAG: hypothetical protein AAF799_23740 [Myxococcota bacterium]